MSKLLGVLLNAAGVAILWFGGVPYSTKETLVNIGPLKAETEVERKLVIPPPVGAGAVALGTVLLLVGGAGKKR